MARVEFGGVMAAWVVSTAPATDSAGDSIEVVTLPGGPTPLTIYDAPDGVVVTDFLDEAGQPTSAITVGGSEDPYIPRFSGPDGVTVLWAQAEGGRWLPIPRWDDGSGTGGGGGTGDVMLEGGNVYEYPDSQSPPWLIIRRPNDNSDSTTWANLAEIWYWDNATGGYRIGFYVNEKALLRVRGTTPSDVPMRVMAHPQHQANTGVFEVTLDDNTVKLFQFFTTQAVYRVPVVVPYLVNPLGEQMYWGTADPLTDPAYADYRPSIGAAWIDYNNPPGA